MRIFDLFFIFVFFLSLGAFLAAAIAALRGRRARSLTILRRWAICAAVYLIVLIAVSVVSPRRILNIGESWCFDDWCLAVEKVERTPSNGKVSVKTTLRIFSEARGVTQRAKGAWIYVVDEKGNRYAPVADPAAVPLDVLLRPGESVSASRVFEVPSGAGELGLITGHGFPCCYPNPIIADEASLFHKRTFVRLP